MANNKKTILYARLSQEDSKDGISNSIQNQELILEKYAKENGFLNTVFLYDDGFSGITMNRPAWKKVMEMVENDEVSTLIVKDLSRAGRDHIEVGRLMHVILPTHDVRFIAINNNVDSNDDDNSFLAPFLNIVNEIHVADTSKKIRASKKAKAETGARMGSRPPYGFLKDPNDPKRKIVVDTEVAWVVKKIFELCMAGNGPTQISRILKNEKILSPANYYFKQTGTVMSGYNEEDPYYWSGTVVSKILSNEAYIGNTVNNQSTVKSYKIKKKVHRPKEEHLRFENTHELIIDKAIFDAVQKLRENRKRPTKRNHPKSIFSGKVFCHDCGEKMRVSHDKRKDGSYRVSFECVTAGIKGKGYCSTHYINEEILKEAVLDDLKRVTDLARSKPKLFSDYVTQLNGKDISKKLKAIHLELSKLEKRENELITLFKKLYEDFALERISEEIFNSLSQGYLEEQKTLKEQIPIKKSELLEVESATKSTETFIAKANKYIVFDELTSELISIFVDKIVIHEKSQRYSRSAIQIIDIHYLDVGILDYASEAEARKKQNIPHYGNTETE